MYLWCTPWGGSIRGVHPQMVLDLCTWRNVCITYQCTSKILIVVLVLVYCTYRPLAQFYICLGAVILDLMVESHKVRNHISTHLLFVLHVALFMANKTEVIFTEKVTCIILRERKQNQNVSCYWMFRALLFQILVQAGQWPWSLYDQRFASWLYWDIFSFSLYSVHICKLPVINMNKPTFQKL